MARKNATGNRQAYLCILFNDAFNILSCENWANDSVFRVSRSFNDISSDRTLYGISTMEAHLAFATLKLNKEILVELESEELIQLELTVIILLNNTVCI